MSLESVCQYACQMADDHEASIITQLMMAQYMQQGLVIPELCQRIQSIPEQRKQMRLEEHYRRLHPADTPDLSKLPPALRTPAAIQIWQTLYIEGLVDDSCQTLCTRTESGTMAAHIAKVLGIREVWKTFEALWGMRGLRSAKDKALDQKKYWDFQKKLDSLIPYQSST